MLKLFATIGIGPNQDVEQQSDATRAGLQRAAKNGLELLKKLSKGRGKLVNGWNYPPLDIGRAGQNSDFITRGALQSLSGICANDPEEAMYITEFQTRDADGGLTIVIQSKAPGNLPAGSYWLQAPSDTSSDNTFLLILRVYVPLPDISFTQTWEPPRIVRMNSDA